MKTAELWADEGTVPTQPTSLRAGITLRPITLPPHFAPTMNMQPCPYCNGTRRMPGMEPMLVEPVEINGELCGTPAIAHWNCYICEGTGEVPDQPVSHCQACGEPTEFGIEWCDHHRPAADLWQALNQHH